MLYHESPWMKINIEDAVAANGGSKKVAKLRLEGPIGMFKFEADSFREAKGNLKETWAKELEKLANMNVDEVQVEINSLGGSWIHSVSIHDYLASFQGDVITSIVGMTASGGTLIAQAGNTRKISDNALYLIHQANGLSIGTISDMKYTIQRIEEINDRMKNIYVKRSGKDADTISQVMAEAEGWGTWRRPEAVKELGLVDEIYEPMDAAASAAYPAKETFDAAASALRLPSLPDDVELPKPGGGGSNECGKTATSEQNGMDETKDKNNKSGGDNKTAKQKSTLEDLTMDKNQINALKESFGSDFALDAVNQEMDYNAALEKGVESLVKAKKESDEKVQTLTTEKEKVEKEKTDLEAQVKKLKENGDGVDPLAGSETPADEKDKTEAQKKEEKEKDDRVRAAMDSGAGVKKETE